MKYLKKYNENIDWDWVDEDENEEYNYNELIDAVKNIIKEDIGDNYYDALDKFLQEVKIDIKKDFISKIYNFTFIIDEYNIEWMTNKIIDAFQWIFENDEDIDVLNDFLLKCIKSDINNVIGFLPEEIGEKF